MAEPEMAAKNIQASVVTIPSPPVIHPSSVSQKLTIRLATPVMAFCVIRAKGVLENSTSVTSVAMPMA